MFRRYLSQVASCLCFLLLAATVTSSARAQVQDRRWSEPFRISSAVGVSGFSNLMIADPFGTVHAFWLEEGSGASTYAMMHASFDGESWSEANDIYVTQSPIDTTWSTTVDQDGNLYVAWAQGFNFRQNQVYYMSAPAGEAQSARNWSEPQPLDILAHIVDIEVDSAGVMHLLYSRFSGQEAGIYHIKSEDSGLSWTEPTWIDRDIPLDYSPASLELAIDEDDVLHVLWHYTPIDLNGGDLIRYTRSVNGGDTWSSPLVIDEAAGDLEKLREAGPVMAVAGDNVHVVWGAIDTGLGGGIRRYHVLSEDSGVTWSKPEQIFGSLNGQAARDDLVADGAGRIHYGGQIRFPQGFYHAIWDGTWGNPELVYLMRHSDSEDRGDRYNVHAVRYAVRNGNQLVASFIDHNDAGDDPDKPRGLYSMHYTLEDVVSSPPLATPTPVLTPGFEQTSIAATPDPTPEASRLSPVDQAIPPAAARPANLLQIGLIPSVALVAGIVVFQVLARRR